MNRDMEQENRENYESEPSKVERIKQHLRTNKQLYIGFGTGIVITAATLVVARRFDARYLAGVTRTALLANKVTVKDQGVLLIQTYERWNGPPSWVVRCVETGRVFTSQADAARRMGISASRISTHLNGATESVNGYHFERVAMAIPRSG